jgi:cytochrome c nitrite reductase small subunit
MAEQLPTTSSVRPRRDRLLRMGLVLPISVAAALGVFAGLGVFTFGYGEGYAYLGNNPQTCANCHDVAVCNDCHTPHDSMFAKYLTKADNGFFHSLAFTTGDFKDPIQIKARNSRVVQESCLSCHRDLVNHMLPTEAGGDMLSCVHCHASVGHAQSIAPRRYEGY